MPRTAKRTTTKRAPAATGRGAYRSSAVKGRGAYKRIPVSRIRGRGGYVGDFLAKAGGNAGQWLGDKAEDWFKSIFGSGAYHMNNIQSNSLISGPQVPEMHSDGRKTEGFRIQHREYIGDVLSQTAFTLQSYAINPGFSSTFPWGASIADSFEQYKMLGCAVEFKSTAAAWNGASAALGKVVMSAEYNSSAAVPFNAQIMENSVWGTSSSPDKNNIMFFECAPSKSNSGTKFIRSAALPANQDINNYDLCRLDIAVQGQAAANQILGELWITYDLLFLKPQVGQSFGSTLPSAHIACTGTVTNSAPYGTVQNFPYNNLGTITFSVDRMTLPKGLSGKYLVVYNIKGGVTAAVVFPTVAAYSGCSLNGIFLGGGSAYPYSGQQDVAPLTASTTDACMGMALFTIPDPSINAIISIAQSVVPTGSSVDIVVTQVNYNFA